MPFLSFCSNIYKRWIDEDIDEERDEGIDEEILDLDKAIAMLENDSGSTPRTVHRNRIVYDNCSGHNST